MGKKESHACGVTENRFRTILILLRTAGVPININNGSLLRSIYNALMTINAYAMFIAICAEIIRSDDLKNFMKTFRILNASSTVYWIHLNLRYIMLKKCPRSGLGYLYPGIIYSYSVVTWQIYTQTPIRLSDCRCEHHHVMECACDTSVTAVTHDTL
jgi:hypothetical protein